MKKAFYITESGRPGPVLIDIPKDVQQSLADMKFPDLIKVQWINPIIDADLTQIGKTIWELLLKAERPIIMAGRSDTLRRRFSELSGHSSGVHEYQS